MIEFRLFILDFLGKWSLNIQIMSYLFSAFPCHFQKILSFWWDLISTKSYFTVTSYKSFVNGFGSRMCINICNTIIKFFGIVNWNTFSFLSINSVHQICLSTFHFHRKLMVLYSLFLEGWALLFADFTYYMIFFLFSPNLNYYNIANFHFNCQLWTN